MKKIKNLIKNNIVNFLNENNNKKEFEEMKDFFNNGGVLQNDVADYHIFIRKEYE